MFAALAAARVQNFYLGRNLPDLVAEAGLKQIDAEVDVKVACGGEIAFELHGRRSRLPARKMIWEGCSKSD